MGFLLLLILAGCGRNRFDYIDIAASEKMLEALETGFASVPDSVAGGRTDYLLSQGVPVADVIVYPGESGVVSRIPDVPYGFLWETIDKETLLNSLHVRSSRLYTDDGRNARILYVEGGKMSLAELNKIAELAAGGAFIGGTMPSACLDPADEAVFQRTAEKVSLSGNVMTGKTIRSILKAAGVKPDVKTKVDSLVFEHRHLSDAEIYRIQNAGTHSGKTKVRFRVRGRRPYQWNPDTGEILPVSYKLKKRSTKVTFYTVPGDDTFIVFASFADKKKMKVK